MVGLAFGIVVHVGVARLQLVVLLEVVLLALHPRVPLLELGFLFLFVVDFLFLNGLAGLQLQLELLVFPFEFVDGIRRTAESFEVQLVLILDFLLKGLAVKSELLFELVRESVL